MHSGLNTITRVFQVESTLNILREMLYNFLDNSVMLLKQNRF